MSQASSAGSTSLTQLDILHFWASPGALGPPLRKVGTAKGFASLGTNSVDRLPAFIARETALPKFSQPELDLATRCGCTRTSRDCNSFGVTEGGLFLARANRTNCTKQFSGPRRVRTDEY